MVKSHCVFCRCESLSALSVRRCVEEAARAVFGERGAASLHADVLRVTAGGALLRVQSARVSELCAALALAPCLRLQRAAPALQLLL